MKILLTGSQGFIGSYICTELLKHGHEVLGIDNYSKYGKLSRSHDKHPKFSLAHIDIVKDVFNFNAYVHNFKPDIIIAGAAMLGGISYFHKFAYDLLATNERIIANTFDAALREMGRSLKKIIVISSSMVYEGAVTFPSKEEDALKMPAPTSTYGFQKLATEFFCKGAWEQYRLPYVVVRPFNCVGVGEDKSIAESDVMSGNLKLTMSHVLPDLVHKVLSGQKPLHLLGNGEQIRCFTHGSDIARAIRIISESDVVNDDFNISSGRAVSIAELAKLIWYRITPDDFSFVSDPAFEYDVQCRIPDTSKAKEKLGFEAEVSLETSIDEVIDHLRDKKYA